MEPLRVQIGSATIKQYGRFRFKSHDAYRGDREIPSFRYWIKLENEDGSEDDIGLISMKESIFPLFLKHLQNWLHEQYIHIYYAHQQLDELMKNEEVDDEAIQGQKYHIKNLQSRYDHVIQALREIASDVRADESIPEPLQELSNEENQT